MIWVGLDLHRKYITAFALDDAGSLVAEHRRLPADAASLVSRLSGLGGAMTVAMEATLHWAWRHDQLTEAGKSWRCARCIRWDPLPGWQRPR